MAKAFLLVQLLLLALSFLALSSHGEELAAAVTSDAVSPVRPPAPLRPTTTTQDTTTTTSPPPQSPPPPMRRPRTTTTTTTPMHRSPLPWRTLPPHPPVHPPAHPPAHPPMGPMSRRFIAVQGVVYCKSCKYSGVETLLGATPLLGAVVKLECNNTKYRPTVQTAKTDKNGYFFLMAPKTITTFAFHKCKASLASSPLPTCRLPSPLHGGAAGAVLRPEKPALIDNLPYMVFNVGPFAFEPQCKP
ncbi:LOW QUALITY PROTEIN: non-classical arabinogalactan protein 31 [Rhodamnia argentea]|uniref:LOW QUALITY PROTEIN: non-classical arabinogalactan protein 31 n=1 Tax=Rhodamnia argentea TaxID=178133 RepID=A0A8B8P2K4_9MYRT|nr:LOW QUALITY PROTEIN: non-classical arabinogalactan protein 31 [Rhodamnia argentea]